MATSRTFLRSRVGRRLFGVFVATAFVPILALAGISYVQVSGELRDQADQRLHAAARGTGQELARRLLSLEASLEQDREDPGLAERIELGAGEAPPDALAALASETRRRLVLLPEQTLLVVPLAGGARRVGVVDEERLFALSHENVLPTGAEFAVAAEGKLLATSLPGVEQAPPEWLSGGRSDELATFRHLETDYLSRRWELFLDASLQAPAWTIVLLEPESRAYAPLEGFRVAFAAATALTVLLVPLLAAGQIRRSLVPLERLHEGARSFADRRLDTRVRVDSPDEFGDLGRAFNDMAGSLAQHFDALAALLDVDRDILGADAEAEIVALLEQHARLLTDCGAAHFVPVAAGAPDPDRVDPRELETMGGDEEAPSRLPEAIRRRLQAPAESCRVFPLAVSGSPLGVLVLDGVPADPSRLPYARQLADQAASALGHLREREERQKLATYDPQSGLPNRTTLDERLAPVAEARAGIGLWVARVDGLARVGHSLGPEAEARLVRDVGARLEAIDRGARVYRIADDAFAGVVADAEEAQSRGRQVLRRFDEPFSAADRSDVRLRAFVGVADHPTVGRDAAALPAIALAAAQDARDHGYTGVRVAAPDGDERVRERLELEAQLHTAFERGELELYYQPIFTASGDLAGAEALMRWNRPDGPVSPELFIPIAEETGLVVELGRWAIGEAARALSAWQAEGLDPIHMHVNVSSRQLDDIVRLRRDVQDVLLSTRLPARDLVLELTETVFTEASDANVAALESLVKLGVRLAVDDFGTGYASLAYLQSFPFSSLKIDQAFVRDLPHDAGNREIVRAVMGMAVALGLEVVAEGVETEQARAFLQELGCHELQGYLFSRPLAADAFRKLYGEYSERGGVAH